MAAVSLYIRIPHVRVCVPLRLRRRMGRWSRTAVLATRPLGHPSGVLQYDAISVHILERPSLDVPVRIARANAAKACSHHARAACLPFGPIGDVEDEQVIFGRRFTYLVSVSCRELEMKAIFCVTEISVRPG